MKSTFFYKEHLRQGEMFIEADYVTFEPGYVVFHQGERMNHEYAHAPQEHLIIRAVHNEMCHELREVLNGDPEN